MASHSPDPRSAARSDARSGRPSRKRARRRIRPGSGRRVPILAAVGVPALIVLAVVSSVPGAIFRADLLRALANPNYALLLLLAATLLFYLEANRPGAVLPASLATLLLCLGLFGLSQLPLNPVAVVAILLAFALLAMEFFFKTRSTLAAVAAAILAFGLARLVHSPQGAPETHLAVHPAVALLVAFLFVFATVPLVRVALQARRNKRIQSVTDPLPVRLPAQHSPE